ncbi:hypothetical protein OS190_19745 [Sulfitobacter sp. F26204]|uniref:hypothetical protein n=1 Tax=Sulfitobacter sp. F26204 TaxID=2996014 RepID=UPI00225E126D|nr:hypothetical protein [Sulfitobacter sp. F26204]MCX7561800.1 hypothetical protein [Sulfitobacter sp. F26204]
MGDNAFVATHDKVAQLINGSSSFENAQPIAQTMLDLEHTFDAHVCLAGFTHRDTFEVFESTNKADYQRNDLSLLDDSMARAAQLSLKKTDITRILRAYALMCTPSERLRIVAGHHSDTLDRIRKKGPIIKADEASICLAVTLNSQPGFSLRLRSKKGATLDVDSIFSRIESNLNGTNIALFHV